MPQMKGVVSPTSGGLAFPVQQGLGGCGAGAGPDLEVKISGVIFYFQTSWSALWRKTQRDTGEVSQASGTYRTHMWVQCLGLVCRFSMQS